MNTTNTTLLSMEYLSLAREVLLLSIVFLLGIAGLLALYTFLKLYYLRRYVEMMEELLARSKELAVMEEFRAVIRELARVAASYESATVRMEVVETRNRMVRRLEIVMYIAVALMLLAAFLRLR